MPILASTTFVNAYGKASVVAVSASNLQSIAGTNDIFVVKYNTLGKALWSARVGSPGGEEGYGIATDSSGNVYVTGISQGVNVSAFNSDGTAFGTVSAQSGAYLVKYNTSGFVQWVTSFDGINSEYGRALSTDSSGNVYLAGQFGGLATAYNSDGTAFGTTLANAGGWDAFIVKYNTSGFAQWVARVASPVGSEIAYGISTDSSGNVYITGDRGSDTTVTAYNSDGTAFGTTLSGSGNSDAFIVKYDTNGIVQWVARFGSTALDVGYAIATDSSGNVYVTGTFNGLGTTFNSDGTSFATTLGTSGNTDAFILKYNTSGFVQWVARIGSSGYETGRAIATDSSGNVYICGDFSGTATAFSSNGVAFGTTLPTSGSSDVFIVKYNTSGIVQWVARVGSTLQEIGYGLDVDSSGNVYISGLGGSNVVITAFNSNGTAFATTIPSSGSADTYVVKYNTSGSVQWVTRLSSSGSDSLSGNAVSVDSEGNMYITAQYQGTSFSVYGQSVSLFSTLPNSGGTDGFIVKYNTNGVPQWATRIASSGSDSGFSITSDSSGDVYVTGQGGSGAVVTAFNSDGTSFGTTLANAGNTDAFIVKYNTSGFVQWVARVASTGADIGYSIATDSSGNVYVTGQGGSGVVTAFNSDGTAFGTTLANSGNSDAFIVKYNTSGFVQWVARVGSTSNDTAWDVTTDGSGNVYVAGGGSGSVLITAFNSDGTTFGTTGTNSGLGDAFIVKYNSSGFVQWTARLASGGVDIGYGIVADSSGNIYVTGQSNSIGVYNSNGSLARQFSSLGGLEVFVVKYNTNGFVQWLTRIASTNGDIGYGITIDSSGNVYVTGNTDTSTAIVNVYNQNSEIFATLSGVGFTVKYDTNGFAKWVQILRQSAGLPVSRSIAVDGVGNAYIAGTTPSGATTFIMNYDLTPYKVLNTSGGSDAYIVKYSSNTTPLWVANIGSTLADIGFAIATDSSGNVYVTGQGGSGVVTAFNSNGTAFGTTLANAGGGDAFIVKYNTSGFVQWVARVATPITGDIGYGITTDSSGNVYVTGQGGSGAVITAYNANGTAFGTTLTNDGFTDAFIVKYDTNGSVQWLAKVSANGNDVGYAITTDPSGNVYVTGAGGAAVVVTAYNANGTAFATTLPNSGNQDSFIVKYNTSGSVQWVARIGGSANEFAYAITSDSSENIYVAGMAGADNVTTAFSSDGTAFGTTLPSAGSTDGFLVKYNTSGIVQWVARVASISNENAFGVATDSAGNVYVVGSQGGVTTAYNADGSAFATTIPNAGSTDAFIVKYNTSGSVQWIARIASTAADFAYAITTDSSGSLYVSGSYAGAPLLSYNSDGTLFGSLGQSTAGLGTETFLVKYDTNGNVQWMSGLGGINTDDSRGIALDSSNNIYITGQFNTSALIPYSV